MTTHEALNRLDEIKGYFIGCYQNAATGSAAERTFADYVLAIDMAWMALNEMEDDGK